MGGLIKYLFTFGRVPLVFDVQGSMTAEPGAGCKKKRKGII